jgi:hypothetical protein
VKQTRAAMQLPMLAGTLPVGTALSEPAAPWMTAQRRREFHDAAA